MRIYVSVHNSKIENNFKGIEVKDGSKAIPGTTKIINNSTDTFIKKTGGMVHLDLFTLSTLKPILVIFH